MSKKLGTRDLEDLLESDDDLPDTYEEVPDIPAYQNDKRFDALQFNSLENEEWPALRKTKQNTSPPKLNKEVNETKKINAAVVPKKEVKFDRPVKVVEELKSENKILVKRGVLSKQDLYCLQALITFSSDVNIIWFVNFLMHKDMQKDKYKFLRSCLIEDMAEKTSPIPKINSKYDLKKYKYELNIL